MPDNASKPIIKTIDDACDLILDWAKVSGDLPGNDIATSVPIPDAVIRLNKRLGRLWTEPHPAFLQPPNVWGSPLGLFNVQDTIHAPSDYAVNARGFVTIVTENQGVWECGYDPGETDRLWVDGEWWNGVSPERTYDWKQSTASVADGLIFALLSNFCLLRYEGDLYDPDHIPDDATDPLWEFVPFKDSLGFYTNKERSLIHYSGMGLDLRR